MLNAAPMSIFLQGMPQIVSALLKKGNYEVEAASIQIIIICPWELQIQLSHNTSRFNYSKVMPNIVK